MADHAYPIISSALDKKRRVWWLPRRDYQASPTVGYPCAYQIVSLVNTQTAAFSGYATDAGNHISSSDRGDLSNRIPAIIIDTKYNQAVLFGTVNANGTFNTSWVSWFDLTTKDCLTNQTVGSINPDWPYDGNRVSYDPVRGYIYKGNSPTSTLAVTIVNCHPLSRGMIASNSQPAYSGGESAYASGLGQLFFGNPAGPNMYHAWNAATNTFALNQGPAGASNSLRFVPTIGLDGAPGVNGLIVVAPGGPLQFIDPISGLVVGTVTGPDAGSLDTITNMDYNSCTGIIYATNISNSPVYSIDPANSFYATPVAATVGFTCTALNFDSGSGRLFAFQRGTNGIITTV